MIDEEELVRNRKVAGYQRRDRIKSEFSCSVCIFHNWGYDIVGYLLLMLFTGFITKKLDAQIVSEEFVGVSQDT
jgi:hypothetical protein